MITREEEEIISLFRRCEPDFQPTILRILEKCAIAGDFEREQTRKAEEEARHKRLRLVK
jgi:hypothetical protein